MEDALDEIDALEAERAAIAERAALLGALHGVDLANRGIAICVRASPADGSGAQPPT
jgi:hypothetical protein